MKEINIFKKKSASATRFFIRLLHLHSVVESMSSKNIVILDEPNKDKALEYAKAFCDRSQMYTQTYIVDEHKTVNRLFDYYLPMEHRLIVIIGADYEDIHRLMNTGEAINVFFSTHYDEDYELVDDATRINGEAIDASSLYEWVVSLNV